jgi:hypothetical protein
MGSLTLVSASWQFYPTVRRAYASNSCTIVANLALCLLPTGPLDKVLELLRLLVIVEGEIGIEKTTCSPEADMIS